MFSNIDWEIILYLVVVFLALFISSFFKWKKVWLIFDLVAVVFFLVYCIWIIVQNKTNGILEFILWTIVLAFVVYKIYTLLRVLKSNWTDLSKLFFWFLKHTWVIVLWTVVLLWLIAWLVYVLVIM